MATGTIPFGPDLHSQYDTFIYLRLLTCFEVSSASLPFAEDFIVGQVTPDGVHVDHDAVRRFLAGQEERRAACRDCFCYWHCCGDCATRSRTSEAKTSVRCLINQRTSRDLIACFIAQGDGVWMGIREEPEPAQDTPESQSEEGCTRES